MAITRANLHRFETVVQIGVAEFIEANSGGRVWIDANDGGATRGEIGDNFFDPFFVGLSGWAMVTGEDDRERFGIFEIV